jgi:hypothetical protein
MAGDSDSVEPTLRKTKHQNFDQVGQKFLQQTEKLEKKTQGHQSQKQKDKTHPAGGFDSTLPKPAPPGYTLKFIFHRAHHLPFADINTLSSDPYIMATLKTDLPKRHKEDADLRFRTPTIQRNTEPIWDAEWVVANVPASGFFLKCRIYDEDPADHDDRLGNVHVPVQGISDTWPGIKEQTFEVKARMGSKRAYLVRGCATMFSGDLHLRGTMTLSVENLGRTPGDYGSKAYTVGPICWSRHFSPLIGRLTGIKDGDEESDKDGHKKDKKAQKYKSVRFPARGTISFWQVLTFSLAFKLSRYSSLVQSLTSFTIVMSSLSLSSLACSRRTLFAAAYSTALYIINTHEYTTTIARQSMASSRSRPLK